jgi:protein PET117
MSTAAKITLALTTAATIAVIYTVHQDQVDDRARLHQGIVKDLERQQRKTENLVKLQQQQELTKNFRRIEKQQEQE